MKTKSWFLPVLLASVLQFSFLSSLSAQSTPSNYVVIGAFAIQQNAVRFVGTATKLNYKAVIGVNTTNNWYYVYVLKTDDIQPAIDLSNKIRETTSIKDVWVFTGVLDGQEEKSAAQPVQARLEKKSDLVPLAPPPTEAVTEQADEGALPEKPVNKPAENKAAPEPAPVTQPPVKVQEQPKNTEFKRDTIEGEKAMKLLPHALESAPDAPVGSKNFVFRIFTALDNIELAGDVDVMDVDRAVRVGSFKGNENVVIHPLNKSGKLLLVCEVFGYRPVKISLDFNKPQETPDLHVDGNRYLIPFSLTRMKKGDIEVMYNVYFFKDAAVMRPESKPEITSLLEMMKENPKYKIRIHGHTNGNSSGKIISKGDSKKFFSLEGTKEGYGSAKKLSEERAKVIREFLDANGIDPARTEIKAWGGKKPIHDKLSALARENVRVEVEIIED